MTSRERVALALNHQEPDRVPLDLGGSAVTGMHVSSVYRLRQALGLDAPGTPVNVIEPIQMLGEVAPDLVAALDVDVLPLGGATNKFGFKNEGWKPWTSFDGTPVLVPGAFNTDPEPSGTLHMYPEGDKSVPPSARMPAGGYYFDALSRQEPIDEAALSVEDNLEEFAPISDAELADLRDRAEALHSSTDKAILASFGGTAFGDIALVPGTWMKYPKGIRDVEEWYVSTVTRPDHIRRIFARQCEIALANLEKVHQVVGERISVLYVTGTDFGTQQGPFVSPQTYRDLYFPFHKAVNDWVHAHTTWKTFMHSCGSLFPLLEDIITAGFDILNPIQTSAAQMDPVVLKQRFGDHLTFWGGGVDTQRTLPFGTPEEVREEVRARLRTFGPGGGFVFNSVHNIQAGVPIENLLSFYDAFRQGRDYPLS